MNGHLLRVPMITDRESTLNYYNLILNQLNISFAPVVIETLGEAEDKLLNERVYIAFLNLYFNNSFGKKTEYNWQGPAYIGRMNIAKGLVKLIRESTINSNCGIVVMGDMYFLSEDDVVSSFRDAGADIVRNLGGSNQYNQDTFNMVFDLYKEKLGIN